MQKVEIQYLAVKRVNLMKWDVDFFPHCEHYTRRPQVFRVLFGRVLSVLKAIVSGEDADKACGRHGLQAFVGELRPVGVRLRRLFSHSLKASRLLYPLSGTHARDQSNK